MHSLMPKIRSLAIITGAVLSTALFAPLAIAVSIFSRRSNGAHIIGRIWARSLLWISRIRVDVKGWHHIDPGASYIYMANHQSQFDIPVLLAHLRVQFRWLAKVELFRIPIFGLAMRRAGYISIDRSDRESAIESLRAAAIIIRNGTSVLIFPEGTRSRDGSIHPFKKGGFVLAVDAGVPVVPVVIHGTWGIMPKQKLLITPGRVTLEILPPIDTTGYRRETKDQLLSEVQCVITNAFQKQKEATGSC